MPSSVAKGFAVSNVLIVESKNDKIFLEALIAYMNAEIAVDSPIQIDDYDCLNGLDPKKVTTSLKALQADAQKKNIRKAGLILDCDNLSEVERLAWVNTCLQAVFGSSIAFNKTQEFVSIAGDNYEFSLACYFTNVGGQGELETLLRCIKARQSPAADCLSAWQDCWERQAGTSFSPKDFDKFWLAIYLRYDTCSASEQRQAGRKCSMAGFDYIMREKREIWNFEAQELDALKGFLRLF